MPSATYTPMTPASTSSAHKWLSVIGMSGAAFAAYALESIYGCGSIVGISVLYPASVAMVLLTPPAKKRPRIIQLGSAVPV